MLLILPVKLTMNANSYLVKHTANVISSSRMLVVVV